MAGAGVGDWRQRHARAWRRQITSLKRCWRGVPRLGALLQRRRLNSGALRGGGAWRRGVSASVLRGSEAHAVEKMRGAVFSITLSLRIFYPRHERGKRARSRKSVPPSLAALCRNGDISADASDDAARQQANRIARAAEGCARLFFCGPVRAGGGLSRYRTLCYIRAACATARCALSRI